MTHQQGDVFERVARYVESHPGAVVIEIRVAVPAIRGAVPAALRRLEKAGIVECRRGRYRALKRPYGRAAA